MSKINKAVFGKYFEIDKLPEYEDMNFIDEFTKGAAKNIDDAYFKLLTELGYKIDRPYNTEQLNEIVSDLKRKGKFLNRLEFIETTNNGDSMTLTHHMIPFLDDINNPLSKESQEFLIGRWKEINRKDK